jgi:hypothetical protein
MSDGSDISASEEEKHNLYQMNVHFDITTLCHRVGQIHPRFPEQQHIASHKPTLREVIDAVQPLLK